MLVVDRQPPRAESLLETGVDGGSPPGVGQQGEGGEEDRFVPVRLRLGPRNGGEGQE